MGVSASRPSFPRHSEFLLPGAEFALLPFGADSLTHFLYLERPEGMERVDAAEFVPAVPPPDPVAGGEVMPRPQGFLTAGHLYRGIEQGLSDLAGRLGEPVLFVGEPRAQATPDRFRWPQLIAVRSEEHTSELQSRPHLVCRLLLEKKKKNLYTLLVFKKKKKNKKS